MQLSLPLWRPQVVTSPVRPATLPRTAPGGWIRRDDAVMGTVVHVELWADRRAEGEAAVDAVLAEILRVDRSYSTQRPDAELSRLNRMAASAPVVCSEETFGLLARARACAELSGGAFDLVRIGPGGRRRGPGYAATPARAEPSPPNLASGWQGLSLDPARRSVRFAHEGMAVDLSVVAAGHALDCAAARLHALGVRHAHLRAGSDRRIIGNGRDRGRPWSIAIPHPGVPDRIVAMLPLEQAACATTVATDPNGLGRDGEGRHAPATPGSVPPPRPRHSVTIVADDGLTSAALSRAVSTLGIERGLAVVARVPGAEAVVVDAEGRLHVSAGLLPRGSGTPAASRVTAFAPS